MMGYSREIYDEADKVIRDRRNKALKDADIRKERFFKKYPEAQKLEEQLSHTMTDLIRTMLSKKTTLSSAMNKLKAENLATQMYLQQIYAKAGITKESLEPQFVCKKCQDKGNIDGKVCDCYRQLVKEIAYQHLNELSPLKLSSFDTFSLHYYSNIRKIGEQLSEREQMRLYFEKCKSYASTFSANSRSIIMRGDTGLGKTHLSLAIAREVIEKGFGVIYCSAPDILSRLEKEQFNRNYNKEENVEETLKECDLLILDDIGSEFSTNFTKNKIYNLINHRLSCNRPTIINTNFTFSQLEQTYSQRLISRIMGEYMAFNFVGRDIRQMKRAEQMNGQNK